MTTHAWQKKTGLGKMKLTVWKVCVVSLTVLTCIAVSLKVARLVLERAACATLLKITTTALLDWCCPTQPHTQLRGLRDGRHTIEWSCRSWIKYMPPASLDYSGVNPSYSTLRSKIKLSSSRIENVLHVSLWKQIGERSRRAPKFDQRTEEGFVVHAWCPLHVCLNTLKLGKAMSLKYFVPEYYLPYRLHDGVSNRIQNIIKVFDSLG